MPITTVPQLFALRNRIAAEYREAAKAKGKPLSMAALQELVSKDARWKAGHAEYYANKDKKAPKKAAAKKPAKKAASKK
jgi:hypothetical protein